MAGNRMTVFFFSLLVLGVAIHSRCLAKPHSAQMFDIFDETKIHWETPYRENGPSFIRVGRQPSSDGFIFWHVSMGTAEASWLPLRRRKAVKGRRSAKSSWWRWRERKQCFSNYGCRCLALSNRSGCNR